MATGSLAPPLSAFAAYGVGARASAHNLANVLTGGFQAGRVIYGELPGQTGVRADTVQKTPAGGPLVPSGPGLPASVETGGAAPAGFVEGSATDVAREMISLIVNSRTYQANAVTVGTVDEMLGAVINLKV